MRRVVLASILATYLSAGGVQAQATEDAPSPPTVTVMVAVKKPIAEEITVTGSFAANELVLVSPEIEGLSVIEILAEEGDEVTKGQVLARLNDAQIRISRLEAEANLARNEAALAQGKNAIEQAQINVDRAKDDLNRTKKLRTSGVATLEAFEQRQAAYDLALAQLASAKLALGVTKADRMGIEAQMEDLKLRESRTQIKAPVAGYISNRSVDVGAIASGHRAPMFTIVANGVVKLLAEIPESDLPRIKVGLKASITLNGFNRPIEGEVKLISPEVNPATRIGIAHIRVADDIRIPLGAFGRAKISLAAAEAVVLPLAAVTFGDDGPTVQIVKDGKVEVRKVITGLVSNDEIEITSGVSPGETFVARAGTFVRDGDLVTPVVIDKLD